MTGVVELANSEARSKAKHKSTKRAATKSTKAVGTRTKGRKSTKASEVGGNLIKPTANGDAIPVQESDPKGKAKGKAKAKASFPGETGLVHSLVLHHFGLIM